ncbi:aldo/keto reductase [Arcanobacterium haemolyticum]|nr:aldo/keto reductase [Arcanobacterium haemolyticum]
MAQATRIQLSPDLSLSRVAHGYWRWEEWGITVDDLANLIPKVIDLGITTFDHADGYAGGAAEPAFGEALKKSGVRREDIEIISKATLVYPDGKVKTKYYDTSKAHLIKRVEDSLRKLQTDYLDLFLLHRPDPLMNPEETAAAFDELYASGKVRNFGVSNYKPIDFEMLQKFSNQPLVTNQIEVSVLQHENFDDRTVQHAVMNGIHPIVWSPLAGGRIFTGEGDVEVRVRQALEEVRDEIGAEAIDDVAFAWLFKHPVGFIPITGAAELEFIRRPIEALKYELTKEQYFKIWAAKLGRRIP